MGGGRAPLTKGVEVLEFGRGEGGLKEGQGKGLNNSFYSVAIT